MCTYLNRTGSKYYFRRPVPKDLIGQFKTDKGGIRREWKYSLGVTDRERAKPLLRPYEIETDQLIADAREKLPFEVDVDENSIPVSLRQQEEAQALAATEAARVSRYEARSELRTLIRQRMQLSTAELFPDEAAARDLIRERGDDLQEYARQIALLKSRIEELGGQPQGSKGQTTEVSLMGLFEGYASKSGARQTTISGFRSHVRSFTDCTGLADAAKIELRHIIQWIDWLRLRPGKRGGTLAERTIRTGYLAALRLTLSYGVSKLLLPRNVMQELRLMKAKRPVINRAKSFNEQERITILTTARGVTSDREGGYLNAARRWVPWLCAYTGARVGEILQLRQGDIRQEDGVWAIHLTPMAGDLKTNQQRWVPLHEHLIAEGFTDWANQRKHDRLFYKERPAGSPPRSSPPYQAVYNRLREWLRGFVPDPDVQPCHAWRHTFKSLARDYGMESETVDVIQGHRPATVGKSYGDTSMRVMLRELSKLPRFNVGD